MASPTKIVDGIPVFEPDFETFKDFQGYLNKVKQYGMESGIIKIIPPKAWLDLIDELVDVGADAEVKPLYSDEAKAECLSNIVIKNPIEQYINGSNNFYTAQNTEKLRSYNIIQWQLLSQERYIPPRSSLSAKFEIPMIITNNNGNKKSRRKKTEEYKIHDFMRFQDFLKEGTTSNNLDPGRLKFLKEYYWKTLHIPSNPLYGADILGSLFPKELDIFNIAKLPNILTEVIKQSIPGVNKSYLYAGLWRASFP